jgi:hypothetical protein
MKKFSSLDAFTLIPLPQDQNVFKSPHQGFGPKLSRGCPSADQSSFAAGLL